MAFFLFFLPWEKNFLCNSVLDMTVFQSFYSYQPTFMQSIANSFIYWCGCEYRVNFVLIGYVQNYGRKQTSLRISLSTPYGCVCDKFNHHPVCALNLRQKDWPFYHIYYIYIILSLFSCISETLSLIGRLPSCVLSIAHHTRHITRILFLVFGDTRLKASLLCLFIWLVVLCTSYHMNPFSCIRRHYGRKQTSLRISLSTPYGCVCDKFNHHPVCALNLRQKDWPFYHIYYIYIILSLFSCISETLSLIGRLPSCVLSIAHHTRHITRILFLVFGDTRLKASLLCLFIWLVVLCTSYHMNPFQGVIWSGYVPNCPLGQTLVFKADLVPPSRLLFCCSWNKCTSCSYPTRNRTEMKNHENGSKLN